MRGKDKIRHCWGVAGTGPSSSGVPLWSFSLNPTPFTPSLGPPSPWTLLPSPDLPGAVSGSVNCKLQLGGFRMSHWWLQMLEGWFDSSQHQNLPRKGGKLLFFTHFVSHVSILASIVFCVFNQLEISIASWNLNHQCHTRCTLTQTAATIPWVWREGFNKGK